MLDYLGNVDVSNLVDWLILEDQPIALSARTLQKAVNPLLHLFTWQYQPTLAGIPIPQVSPCQ